MAVRTCRVCGCTDDDCSACIEKTGKWCYWVEPDLCSACALSLDPAPQRPVSGLPMLVPLSECDNGLFMTLEPYALKMRIDGAIIGLGDNFRPEPLLTEEQWAQVVRPVTPIEVETFIGFLRSGIFEAKVNMPFQHDPVAELRRLLIEDLTRRVKGRLDIPEGLNTLAGILL